MGATLPPAAGASSAETPAPESTSHGNTTVVVDPTPDEYGDSADSTYDSEVASYTTSLASSVTDFKFSHGRRYHAYKEGTYIYPNDDKENDRLDMVHEMLKLAMQNKLYYAPLNSPKRILDLGTGTGIWAMDMADAFPNAEVMGNDLSPIQPRWIPPNLTFEVDDIESPWTYSRKFDFIHCRGLGNAVHDWPKLLRQAYEFTAPGGSVEFVDYDVAWRTPDNSLKEGSPIHMLISTFIQVNRENGQEPSPGPLLEGWMKDAGFVDIKVTKMPMPIGTWAADKKMKEIGAWNYAQIIENLEGFFYALFSNKLGYSKEEIDVLCARGRAQLRDPKVHCMWHLYVVHGSRPASAGDGEDDDEEKATVIEEGKPSGAVEGGETVGAAPS